MVSLRWLVACVEEQGAPPGAPANLAPVSSLLPLPQPTCPKRPTKSRCRSRLCPLRRPRLPCRCSPGEDAAVALLAPCSPPPSPQSVRHRACVGPDTPVRLPLLHRRAELRAARVRPPRSARPLRLTPRAAWTEYETSRGSEGRWWWASVGLPHTWCRPIPLFPERGRCCSPRATCCSAPPRAYLLTERKLAYEFAFMARSSITARHRSFVAPLFFPSPEDRVSKIMSPRARKC